MHDAEQYLLRVLRGFVLGEDPGAFSGDWQRLLELSYMHSVTGILGHSVMSWPHEDSAPRASRHAARLRRGPMDCPSAQGRAPQRRASRTSPQYHRQERRLVLS